MINATKNEFGYFSKDVAIELEITTSTLRRWSIELEKEGYNFNRNEKEQLIYYERDFKALRELKKLLSNNVPFSDAIKAIASTDFENKNAKQTPSVYIRYNTFIKT
ncbi:MerR family transcriptional regulator [Pseudogracilibacillus sp. SO30301A]|uniref:MerR family transcriptional regulator n=1 Tax=Pseudogracilibacillus sp. SO30301A TaxID=3098291 RepID=UPI00300E220F